MSRARGSMWHYLLALALVPTIAVALAGTLLVRERLQEARAARTIARSMSYVAQLDGLRSTLNWELTSTLLQEASVAFHLSHDQAAALFGSYLPVPVPQARASTDRQLSDLRRAAPNDSSLGALPQLLVRARRGVDATMLSPAAALIGGFPTALDFTRIVEAAETLEQSVTSDLVRGQSGWVPPAVGNAAWQLHAVTALSVTGGREADLVYLILVAPGSQSVGLLTQLDAVSGAYAKAAGELSPTLSVSLRSSYQQLATGGEQTTFQRVINRWLTAGRPSLTSLSPQIASDAVALGHFSKALGALLHSAVGEGTHAAGVARTAAEQRAWWTALTTILLFLLPATVFVSVSVLIHRRLAGLAVQATQLRAGQFTPVRIRGPREVAAATLALNDSAKILQTILVKAEQLAEGNLTAPELDEGTPGPLGTVVDASIQSVRRAMGEREAFRRQLSYLASHDSLTGLPNRSEADALVAGALRDAHSAGTRVAILFVDLDRFKECNDTFGHRAGDHALQVAAERMRAAIRPADTVCRLGGDEFVILLSPAESEENVIAVGERVAAALAQPDEYEGTLLTVTASVGVAISEPGTDVSQGLLLHCADLAVYEAKACGGATCRVYRPLVKPPSRRATERPPETCA